LLSDLIDEINKITVPTAFGPSGTPTNTAQFNNIKNRLEDMLSNLVRIGDKSVDDFRIPIVDRNSVRPPTPPRTQEQIAYEHWEQGANTRQEAFNATKETLFGWIDELGWVNRNHIHIISGIRTPEQNANAVGGSPTSQHLIGEAIDFSLKSPLNTSENLERVFRHLICKNYHQLIRYERGSPLDNVLTSIHIGIKYQNANQNRKQILTYRNGQQVANNQEFINLQRLCP
jgi:hypothetical protein